MGGSHLLTYQTQSYTAHVCCQITLLNKLVGHARSYETKGYMASHMYFTFLKFAWNSWSCPSSKKIGVQLMIIVFYIAIQLCWFSISGDSTMWKTPPTTLAFSIHADNILSTTCGLHPWQTQLWSIMYSKKWMMNWKSRSPSILLLMVV